MSPVPRDFSAYAPDTRGEPQKSPNRMNCLKNSLWQVESIFDSDDVLRERFPELRIDWGMGL